MDYHYESDAVSAMQATVTSMTETSNTVNHAEMRWAYNRLGAELHAKYPNIPFDSPEKKKYVNKKQTANKWSAFIRKLTTRRKVQRHRQKHPKRCLANKEVAASSRVDIPEISVEDALRELAEMTRTMQAGLPFDHQHVDILLSLTFNSRKSIPIDVLQPFMCHKTVDVKTHFEVTVEWVAKFSVRQQVDQRKRSLGTAVLVDLLTIKLSISDLGFEKQQGISEKSKGDTT
ncbi:unnamed protein product [Darwinula stevensoni]|uniref:Uncharacterized protein n=1 Tax=Darwinula stevensoni TaxID=69355 RepID=A0A7R8X1R9_9CRUS|nr:unnamed protein product [Darwinula stevensoni]CAG0880405.1 unnamed protein product [Darwinula stevensoni]